MVFEEGVYKFPLEEGSGEVCVPSNVLGLPTLLDGQAPKFLIVSLKLTSNPPLKFGKDWGNIYQYFDLISRKGLHLLDIALEKIKRRG